MTEFFFKRLLVPQLSTILEHPTIAPLKRVLVDCMLQELAFSVTEGFLLGKEVKEFPVM